MIEETHPNEDSYVVRVKAVVMTRDDSSGGWLATDGGALTRVGVCRVLAHELGPGLASELGPGLGLAPASGSSFLIRGERLRDKQVILDCPLRKDLVYTVATPTFHHWKVENRKCGLSFQSPADARAFDRGVRKAIEDLAEGSTTSSTALQNEGELGDDDVFTNATDSSSNSSSQKLDPPLESSPLPQRHRCMLGHRHDLHDTYRLSDHYFLDPPLSRLPRHVTFQEDEEIVRINPRERSWERAPERPYGHQYGRGAWLKGYEDYRHASVRDKFIANDDESESYVQFKTDKHEYTYPLAAPPPPSDPETAPKGGHFAVSAQPRKDGLERAQCEHCGEAFYVSENRRGRCHDAPDPVGAWIRRVSCMWLADTMLYHCMSDPEGEFSDPCSCDGAGDGSGRFGSRWLALLGLSLVAPCLCLYPPLAACHRAALRCGCCGGRHKALS